MNSGSEFRAQPPFGVPVVDNHVHLDPSGPCMEAVKDFKRSGGTHLVVVNKPYHDIPVSDLEGFKQTFRRTVELSNRASSVEGIMAFAVVGPYPVELIRLAEKMSLNDAEQLMLDAMELAAEMVSDGQAIAIGEVGRPHFPVSEDIWAASNRIIERGMSLAKGADCPVVIHCETATEQTWKDLASMGDGSGLPRKRIIKHFSPPVVDESINSGIFPSVMANRKNIPALEGSTRFFLETDYLDDPGRPGAVLGIKTVPKRVGEMLSGGKFSRDDIREIMADNFCKIYGVEEGYFK